MISYLGESPGGIFEAIARLGAPFSSYLHILFAYFVCIFCLHILFAYFVCIAHFTAEWYSFSLLWAFFSLFFFLYTRLSSAFDFSMSKDFSISIIFEAQKMIAFSSDIIISDKLAHFN